MPVYEYKCEDGHFTIDKRSIHDNNEPTKCSQCGGSLIQVIGNLGVSFRGSGFYTTDKNK